jgi:hypothetical protein
LSQDGSRKVKFDELSDQLKLEFLAELKRIQSLNLPQDIIKCIDKTKLFPDRQSFERIFGKTPEKFAEFFIMRRDILCNK